MVPRNKPLVHCDERVSDGIATSFAPRSLLASQRTKLTHEINVFPAHLHFNPPAHECVAVELELRHAVYSQAQQVHEKLPELLVFLGELHSSVLVDFLRDVGLEVRGDRRIGVYVVGGSGVEEQAGILVEERGEEAGVGGETGYVLVVKLEPGAIDFDAGHKVTARGLAGVRDEGGEGESGG